MPGIGLIQETAIIDPDDAIEDAHGFGVLLFDTESPLELDFKVLLEVALIDIECLVGTQAGQIVSMHHAAEALLRGDGNNLGSPSPGQNPS